MVHSAWDLACIAHSYAVNGSRTVIRSGEQAPGEQSRCEVHSGETDIMHRLEWRWGCCESYPSRYWYRYRLVCNWSPAPGGGARVDLAWDYPGA